MGKLFAHSEGVHPAPPNPSFPSGKVSISKQLAALPSRERKRDKFNKNLSY